MENKKKNNLFNESDKVRVREDLTDNEKREYPNFTESMEQYKGKELTISAVYHAVYEKKEIVIYDVFENGYVWREEWFESTDPTVIIEDKSIFDSLF